MVNSIVLLYIEQIGCSIDSLVSEIKLVAHNVSINPIILFRVKDGETLLKKMAMKLPVAKPSPHSLRSYRRGIIGTAPQGLLKTEVFKLSYKVPTG